MSDDINSLEILAWNIVSEILRDLRGKDAYIPKDLREAGRTLEGSMLIRWKRKVAGLLSEYMSSLQ